MTRTSYFTYDHTTGRYSGYGPMAGWYVQQDPHTGRWMRYQGGTVRGSYGSADQAMSGGAGNHKALKVAGVVIAAVVALIVVIAVAASGGGGTSNPGTPAPADNASSSHTVELTATGAGAESSWGTPGSSHNFSGDFDQVITVPADPPAYYAVTVFNGSCQITYDGKVISSNSGSLASCEVSGDGQPIS